MSNLAFEDRVEELDQLLVRYRAKWQLTAISWMDYDDVCQIIRLHVFNKWHLWDQERPFKPWASITISNQIKNLVRNHYSNFAKPCLKCPHYMGGDECAFTKKGIQNEECDLFAKWKKKKEKAYNLKLPLPMEEGVFLGQTHQDDNFDYNRSSEKLHKAIISQLPEKQAEIYSMLFVNGATDQEVAEKYGFKLDSNKRKTSRYKHLINLKKKFYEMAVLAMDEHDIL